MAKLEGWVAKLRDGWYVWDGWLNCWMGAKLEAWVAKLWDGGLSLGWVA